MPCGRLEVGRSRHPRQSAALNGKPAGTVAGELPPISNADAADAAQARRGPITDQPHQSGNTLRPGRRAQPRLVGVQLLVESEDVAENRRALKQCDARIVRLAMGPAAAATASGRAGSASARGNRSSARSDTECGAETDDSRSSAGKSIGITQGLLICDLPGR